MNKKVVSCILVCIILLWCCRIYNINQVKKGEYQIQMGEELQVGNIRIIPVEARLFSRNDFLTYFNLSEDVVQYDEENCKYICVALDVSNITQEDISWDFIMDATTCGFETKTWASISDFNIANKINIFQEACLQVGQSQKIWHVTAVNPISFKAKTWKNLECNDFSYILSLVPQKTRIQLE